MWGILESPIQRRELNFKLWIGRLVLEIASHVKKKNKKIIFLIEIFC